MELKAIPDEEKQQMIKRLAKEMADSIFHGPLNNALHQIQDKMGIDSGDYAAVHFSGNEIEDFCSALLGNYISAEEAMNNDPFALTGKDEPVNA